MGKAETENDLIRLALVAEVRVVHSIDRFQISRLGYARPG